MNRFKCAFCGTDFNTQKTKQECCSLECRYALQAIRQQIPLSERIWKYVEKTETCWLFKGALDSEGYGFLNEYIGEPIKKTKMRRIRAHRLSWEMHFGPIPEGLGVLHKCDVRNCVNPDHLFLGTNTDNNADMVAKNRHRKGGQINTCKLTPEQVLEIRSLKGKVFQRELAERYGITRISVQRIQYGKSWKHLT